jgi:hypothetical protein
MLELGVSTSALLDAVFERACLFAILTPALGERVRLGAGRQRLRRPEALLGLGAKYHGRRQAAAHCRSVSRGADRDNPKKSTKAPTVSLGAAKKERRGSAALRQDSAQKATIGDLNEQKDFLL